MSSMTLPVVQGRGRSKQIVAYAIVDHADYFALSAHEWRMHQGYALCRSARCAHTERLFMHRLVLGLGNDDGVFYADHINRDKLDNRRSNLRIVRRAENNQNQAPRVATSRHRGVSWSKHSNKWLARAQVNGCIVHLGYFENESAAAKATSDFRAQHMPFSVEHADV